MTEYDKGTILCPVKLAILIIAEFTFILGPLGPSGVIPIEIPDLSDLTIFLIASEPPFEWSGVLP